MIQSVNGQQSQSFQTGVAHAEIHLKQTVKAFKPLSRKNAAFNKGGAFDQDKYNDYYAGYTHRMDQAGVTSAHRPHAPAPQAT